jgi:dephospho-CoA kinase
MYVIGLTGNFGTGKTTVSKILEGLGANIINADEIGHGILYESSVKNELVSVFGDSILDEKGEIDRRRLGEIAFQNKEKARELNKITHRRIRAQILEAIANLKAENQKVVILEAAVMPRWDWVNIIDEQWVTTASTDEIINRLKRERGYSEEEVLSRLKRQTTTEEMVKEADILIDTNCSLEELKEKVTGLWTDLVSRINQKP